ncbi:hypothetical protein DFH09DRAFT_1188681 [Mycena vulgaris]|nr:hypothetical protein DFH09DRAFT_1188681 [Mycena vulgaris]
MDLSARIPVELWDEVFRYLEDVRHLHLVNRLFYRLSTPFLFRTFHFRSFIDTPKSGIPRRSLRVVPPTPSTDDALARLKFWSSPIIAPLVRDCRISFAGTCRVDHLPIHDLLPKIHKLEGCFRNVHTLTLVGLDLATVSDSLPLLAKFPAVQTLKEYDSWRRYEEVNSEGPIYELPALQKYRGSYELLRFLHLPHLHHLYILECNFPKFIAELRTIQRLHNVISLEVEIKDYVQNLDGLGELFPSLKKLEVCIITGELAEFGNFDDLEPMDKWKAFLLFEQLTNLPSLPVHLEKIDIWWFDRVQDPTEFDPTTIVRPDTLQKLKDTLLSRHSGLTRLRLGCVDYTLLWGRNPADGKECCEVDRADDSRRRFYDSDTFWNSHVDKI